MIELAGQATAGPSEEGRLTHVASTDATDPILGGLVFDDTMAGLTLDDVSVVLVADRPVLVPLARDLAERSGFTVVDVSDESLLSLGVAPRRPFVEPTPPVVEPTPPVVEPTPPVVESRTVAPVAPTWPAGDVDDIEPRRPDASASEDTRPNVGSWASWPSPDPSVASAQPWPGAAANGRPGEDALLSPSLPGGPAASGRNGAATDRPVPIVQSLTEAPVETARPINSMAASHLDWEPEALGWPYIDRRLDLTAPEPALVGAPATPRSLASGRPVNGVAPTELVIHGDASGASDTDDVIIELRGVASVSVAPLTIDIDAMSFTVLSGPRGSGKTSMLRLLAGFDAPTQGTGVVGGEQLLAIPLDDRAAREAISAGFVPQLPFLVPDLTVAENVELPLLASDVSPAMARGVAEETVRMVGLGAAIGVPASVLSGSEVRLCAVARALVSSPEIVFADEPLAGLSDDDAATVLSCLHDVVADGGTVIIVCTDPRVRLHGVRQLTLAAGVIVRDEVVSTIG